MQTILQPKAILMQQLIVTPEYVTISCMKKPDDLLAFAARLNEVCDDMEIPPKGKSRQSALADKFDVSQNGARKWLEAEGYPTLAMCIRIADWSGVQVEWLLTQRGEKYAKMATKDTLNVKPITSTQRTLLEGFSASDPTAKETMMWLAERAISKKSTSMQHTQITPSDLSTGDPATSGLVNQYLKNLDSTTDNQGMPLLKKGLDKNNQQEKTAKKASDGQPSKRSDGTGG